MASALANRYARALVDVVTKPPAGVRGDGWRPPEITPEQITGQLRDFIAVFRTSSELRNVLLSPAVAREKKKIILDEIGRRLGLGRIPQNFLRVVMDHRRLDLIEDIVTGFEALLDERMGILRAGITAAQPVDPDQQSVLAARLGQLTGKQVRLHFSINPRLLGGVVARIDSTIYDGSVLGRLRALERRLAAE
ncbi:MAG TPA: ATP synthase F1 subunit delta [Bryobacterales bacterium]|jgi:F-type H+-transporting ATPase subunit delta|nr:ATP synthase F1 subunit delta [Bryobacterales bacterium]